MKLKYKSLKNSIKKKKLWIFTILFIGFFFMTIIKTQDTKGDATTEYTEFLENDALVEYSSVGIYGDYFNLLQEKAIQDNSFRNYFATGNIPYNVKTQNSWIYYQTSATNYKYGVVQSYFDLTNDDTFRNDDIINNTYEYNSLPEQNDDFEMNKGYIISNGSLGVSGEGNYKVFHSNNTRELKGDLSLSDIYNVPSTQNLGICHYDGYLYRTSFTTDILYKYDLDFVLHDSLYMGQDTNPMGICYYDGYLWTVGNGNNRVYKYNMDLTYTGVSYSLGIHGGGGWTGILHDGSNFWVNEATQHTIHKYTNTFTWISGKVLAEMTSNYGADYYNNEYYVGNLVIAYIYDSAFDYTGRILNISVATTNRDFVQIDTGVYVVCNSYFAYKFSHPYSTEFIISCNYKDALESKDTINSMTIYNTAKVNDSISISYYSLSIWNYNLIKWISIDSTITNSFLNESDSISSNYRDNINLEVKFNISILSFNLLEYDLDKFNLTVIYNDVIYNYNNEIDYNVKFGCYTASGSGYQREFTISYTINSTGVSWKWSWKVSGMPSSAESTNFVIDNETIDVKNLEIQTHFYYGKSTINTNDVNDYTCIQTNIFLNYNLSLVYNSIYEFNNDNTLYGGVFAPAPYFDTSFIAFFNDYENSDYNNNDYFYNSLVGIRVFRGLNSETYNRFFIIPFFSDGVDLRQYTYVGTTPFDVLNEPIAPSGSTDYWEFTTFRLTFSFTQDINIGNISTNFTMLEVQQYKAKYYYQERVITNRDLGNWRIKINSDIKISFNFIRNTIVAIINILLLFFQYILYLLTYGISFVFMFIVCYIALFFWNYVIYYLYIAILWIFWFYWLFLMWIWNMVLWIWKYIVIPFGSWIWNVLIPIVIDWIIISVAFFLTILVYVLTLGQIDFNETYQFIYDTLWLIVREIYEWFKVFMENIIYVISFIIIYIICLLFLYFRYLIARARGFEQLARKYYYTLTFFFTPFQTILDWIKQMLDITPVA
jgi:hypothetical protein